jgi:hypothetical protein
MGNRASTRPFAVGDFVKGICNLVPFPSEKEIVWRQGDSYAIDELTKMCARTATSDGFQLKTYGDALVVRRRVPVQICYPDALVLVLCVERGEIVFEEATMRMDPYTAIIVEAGVTMTIRGKDYFVVVLEK